jgi:hypothetical protein
MLIGEAGAFTELDKALIKKTQDYHRFNELIVDADRRIDNSVIVVVVGKEVNFFINGFKSKSFIMHDEIVESEFKRKFGGTYYAITTKDGVVYYLKIENEKDKEYVLGHFEERLAYYEDEEQ